LNLRILILNWRCPRNPRAGGAETLTYEVARRLVAMGHTVEWFCASFQGAAATEDLDGIIIVRAGRQWSVHLHAFAHYRKSHSNRFDVVIDEVNTMPFFTPLWAEIPTVMMVFQLAREVWWYESPFPINAVGHALEPLYLSGYRHTPVFTISRSTAEDLRKLGFAESITILPIGIDETSPPQSAKASQPSFLYVGRLAPSKRIEHILEAFSQFQRLTGTGVLHLAGSGPPRYEAELAKKARRLGIADSVVFCGHVSSETKRRMMAEAHALLMTSVREGWGLVVSEASACGTPAIVYDVPGLRDSVRHESTGLVVPPRPANLSAAMLRLINDRRLYRHLAAEGKHWSATFSFDATAHLVSEILQATVAA
jgi:glycosyltransferase involved in cell wall biosynthesis